MKIKRKDWTRWKNFTKRKLFQWFLWFWSLKFLHGSSILLEQYCVVYDTENIKTTIKIELKFSAVATAVL